MQIQFLSRYSFVGSLFLICSAVVCLGIAAHAQSESVAVGPFRTQKIELKTGWNAVYLEVEPLDSDPVALFLGTPIEIVASYFRPASSAEFIESPSELISNRENWSVWYAPERDDALLSNLFAVQGHRAYLIYLGEDYTLSIDGGPTLGGTQWHPNAYSLVGFQIEASEQPTMASFFAGEEAQTPLKIYKMVAGRWVLVTNPESEMLEAGVAYWAYSDGASDFSGPLDVELAAGSQGGLLYTESSGARRVVIRNVGITPQTLTFSLTAGNAGLLPMAYVVTVLNPEDTGIEEQSVPLPESFTLGPLEAGQAFALELEVNQSEVTQPIQSALLTISSDAGVRRQIPIVSLRRDLLEQ